MKPSIYPLFPYPIMVSGTDYKFTSAEKQFISELEMVDNIGNAMSQNDKRLDSEELSGLRSFIDEQIHIFKRQAAVDRDQYSLI